MQNLDDASKQVGATDLAKFVLLVGKVKSVHLGEKNEHGNTLDASCLLIPPL
jgi:hypothetical protein